MLKAAGVLGIAGLVVGTAAVVRDRSSDAASTPTTAAPAKRTVPSREPALPGEAPKNAMPVPSGYELTVLGPMNVAVNLAGGKSDAFVWEQPPVPKLERAITGRVVDAANKPIAGAVVVAGAPIGAHFGDLAGEAGAVTRADGTFSLVLHEETGAFAIALHPSGWSTPVRVPDGTGDAQVTLVAPKPGSMALHVRQGGAPREAQIALESADGGFRLVAPTDEHGELAVPLLPPGEYALVTYASHLATGGASAPTKMTISIVAGRTTDVPVLLPTGVRVLASAWKPGLKTVEYFLYPGTEALELAELKKRGKAGEILEVLFGGQDADRPAILHDVLPGVYTLCVDGVSEDKSHRPFTCKEITVPSDKPELAVDVR